MPQSLAKILVHTVFSTKDRRPFLRDKALRGELHRYLGGILWGLLHGAAKDEVLGASYHPSGKSWDGMDPAIAAIAA